MKAFYELIGEGQNLNSLQMSIRALLIFIIGIVQIRLSGRRSFGMSSPYDNIITILLGAILSRAVTGASPFFPVISASFVFVILHRLCGWITLYSSKFGAFIKGNPMIIYSNGKIIRRMMRRCLVTDKDLKEGLRKRCNSESLEDIKTVYVERDGSITVVKK